MRTCVIAKKFLPGEKASNLTGQTECAFAFSGKTGYSAFILKKNRQNKKVKMYIQQQTLARPVSFNGTGLHSGKIVNMVVKPAPPSFGIRFRRVDLPGQPLISGHFNRVLDTSLATVIGEDGCIVSTIEHLMAALHGLSIDNAIAELDAYEVPIMDGSALVFSETIRSAGIVEQNAPRMYFVIRSPIELRQEDKFVRADPGAHRSISCTIRFDHPAIREQQYSVDLTEGNFAREISPARTFGFFRELEYLRQYGLGKGGSLDNAIVIDQNGVMNDDGLRFADEFVRHKILDSIGDFSLLGMPIMGHIELHKSGHNLNHAFLKEFFRQKKAWATSPIAIPENRSLSG